MTGEDILGDGELGVEAEFLVDRGDTAVLSVSRIRQADGLTMDKEFSLVWSVDTGDNLDQSRFTSSVLTEQCMHLSRLNVERNGIQRNHPWESFGNVPKLQGGRRAGWGRKFRGGWVGHFYDAIRVTNGEWSVYLHSGVGGGSGVFLGRDAANSWIEKGVGVNK
jgi:hypothetical protein